MAKNEAKQQRPRARLPRGFRDIGPAEVRRMEAMLATIKSVYETYGFEPLETPAFEFTDALGKFLPDTDRPNAGVFSLQDDDEQWMSLRYDLTAPLARYVAENFQHIPKPFRRYATGPVWRNEKPGPGRFRQFTQFDADTVGSDSIAADAEICMLAADTLEALGIGRGQYRIRVNNRKVLDGLLQSVGIDAADEVRRLAVLRSLDKLDKFSRTDVALLLGAGRKDESGDFTKGAGLDPRQIEALLGFVEQPVGGAGSAGASALSGGFEAVPLYVEGLRELELISELVGAAGYGSDRIAVDYSVVRGLDYYTGPVFEAELTFEIMGDDGRPVRFGSVGGGGRYDDLIARFTGQRVPATGFSIGVSRLAAALTALAGEPEMRADGPVIVLVLDKSELPRYQRMASALRRAGIRAEMYVGTSNMRKQMQYADRRHAPCVVIQGESERAAGTVQIKDLVEGSRLAHTIEDSEAWRASNPAQFSVSENELVDAVRRVLARNGLPGAAQEPGEPA